jgi:hypothetical protein
MTDRTKAGLHAMAMIAGSLAFLYGMQWLLPRILP